MKMTKIAAAVSAIALSGSALALPTNATYDVNILVSGATAQEKQTEQTFLDYCDLSTTDKYVIFDDGKPGWAITCTSPAAQNPLNAQVNMMMRKQNGGSSDGVEEVSFGSNLDVVAVEAACSADGTQDVNGTLINVHSCPNTTSIPAQVGISDVEPELFTAAINGPKNIAPNAPLIVEPINVSTFGTVVSEGLRDALQSAQGLTVGSDEVADMPSMSSALIANLFAGSIQDWDTLKKAGNIGLTNGEGLDNGAVNLCIRKPGSGTQAQFAGFYLQNPCLGSGAKAFAADSDGVITDGSGEAYATPSNFLGPLPGPHVFYNNGSSDMGRCMTNVSNDNRWAIGFQALEKVKESSSSKNGFKFIRVDGVAPTLENVAAGLYRNWSAASIQINTVTTTGNELTIANDIIDTLQGKADVTSTNASFIAAINTPTILDGGVPVAVGNLALAGVAGNGDADAPFNAANPVMPYNKGLVGPATCSVPSITGANVNVTVQ